MADVKILWAVSTQVFANVNTCTVFMKWWIEVKIEIIMHPHEMWWTSTAATAYVYNVYIVHCEKQEWKQENGIEVLLWCMTCLFNAFGTHSASVSGMQMIRINTKRMEIWWGRIENYHTKAQISSANERANKRPCEFRLIQYKNHRTMGQVQAHKLNLTHSFIQFAIEWNCVFVECIGND